MAIIEVALATEDAVSEAIGLRLLAELPTRIRPNLSLGKKGSGYLRSGMHKWRQLAQRQVVLILTDLDRVACPVALREDWFGTAKVPVDLMLRIAVREVESWILADHEACRNLFGQKGKLPTDPDGLADPKGHLLQLAKQAPRAIKADLLKISGAVASQGIGYNNLLVRWVHSSWSPVRAAERSPSLKRTRSRLHQMLGERF